MPLAIKEYYKCAIYISQSIMSGTNIHRRLLAHRRVVVPYMSTSVGAKTTLQQANKERLHWQQDIMQT